MDASKLITSAASWSSRENFEAVLLVGSHANGTAREDSDIDLVFLVNDQIRWTQDLAWAESFGPVRQSSVEHWGAVETVRVVYENNLEVEFNFAKPDWAKTDPIDPGTLRVISDGAKILFDPHQILNHLLGDVPLSQRD